MVIERRKFLVNTLWSFLGQSSTFVIGLITNIILARILGPFEFGQVGIVMFFVLVINVLIDGGLGGALIRLKTATDEDYSTVFLFNLAISIIFFLLLIASSGTIAAYYNNTKLQPLICASAIMIIISAFNVVQSARIYREMKFKVNLYITLFSVIISSVLGIYLAVRGEGVWSVVLMYIVQIFIKTVLMWFSEGGVGKMVFNMQSFKGMYRYGIYVTLITFFNNAFDNIYQLLLGKYFSIREVGFYYQAKRIQGVPFFILNSLTLGVIFSHLSKFQDDRALFQKEYLKILSVFSIAIGAVASLIFLLSNDAVHIVLGDVWMNSIVYMRLLTIASFFLLLKVFSQNVCKVFNRTDKIFIWELIAMLMQVITIVIGVLMKSIFITMCGAIVSNLVAYVINAFFSWRLLGLNYKGEFVLISKISSSAILSIFISNLIGSIHVNVIIHVLLIVFGFLLVYVASLKLWGLPTVSYLVNVFKNSRQNVDI